MLVFYLGLKLSKNIELLQKCAIENGNIFEHLMTATKYCSLGQITENLFELGGQYRRNMLALSYIELGFVLAGLFDLGKF